MGVCLSAQASAVVERFCRHSVVRNTQPKIAFESNKTQEFKVSGHQGADDPISP